ncbi:hypothetical protein PO909_023707 [Leuciscus waleckii]
MIDTGSVILRVVSCYVPQTRCTEAEKEEFWCQFDDHLRSININEHLLIGGDLNGHVWTAREGYEQLVRDAKGIPSETIASQHRLLVLDLRLNSGLRPQLTGPEKIKWWRLPEKTTQLAAALNTHIAAIDGDQPVETLWTTEVDSEEGGGYRKGPGHAKLYAQLDTPEGANQIYKLANARHRSTLDIGQVINIKDSNHQVLRDPPAILQRWILYFDSICNMEFLHPLITSSAPILRPVPQISLAEVEFAVRKMKKGKAPGPDNIPAEAWKLLGHRGTEVLARLFNKIIDEGTIPSTWAASITVPIWKGKGDVSECNTYRLILLLCHAMKIFERVIDIDKIVSISPNQCGFVRGSGTTDAIHGVRLLLERHREKNQQVHMAFLDLEKAFDRMPRDLIWHSLRSHGAPEEDPATGDIQVSQPWSLLFADDIFQADKTRCGLERQVQDWNERLDAHRLHLNIKKTEYMECGPQTDGTIRVGGQPLNKVTESKYLGSLIRSDGDSLPDARARVNTAWLKWRQVTGILCDRRMPIPLKGKIYKTVVRPVALYGSECWPATTKHEQSLPVMEMKMLRWSLGLTRFDRVMNEDVRNIFVN